MHTVYRDIVLYEYFDDTIYNMIWLRFGHEISIRIRSTILSAFVISDSITNLCSFNDHPKGKVGLLRN